MFDLAGMGVAPFQKTLGSREEAQLWLEIIFCSFLLLMLMYLIRNRQTTTPGFCDKQRGKSYLLKNSECEQICVCVSPCIHVCVCIYIHTYTHTICIHTYYTHTHTHACTKVFPFPIDVAFLRMFAFLAFLNYRK